MAKIKWIALAALLMIAALMAGCLTSSTSVATVKLSPNRQGEAIRVSDQLFATNGEIEVYLDSNAVFKDYKGDISNIDNIGFYMKLTNNDPKDVSFQLFIEPDITADYDSVQQMINEYVELLVPQIDIPANQTVTIDWGQSVQYVEDPQLFADLIKGGVFSLYVGAMPHDVFDITLDSLVMVITLTGNK